MTLALPQPRRFSTLLSIPLLALCLAATAAAQAAPMTHLQLMLPLISGSGYQSNDDIPSDLRAEGVRDRAIDHRQLGLLGLSMGRDFAERLRAEIYGAVLFADGLRGLLGVRGGPQWSLLAPTSTTSTSVDLRLLGLVGISYRGQQYGVCDGGPQGQRAIALTLAPAMEYTYFSSPSLGWSVRLKTELSYVIDQIGSPVFFQPDAWVGSWDGYRWGLTGGLDLGLVL